MRKATFKDFLIIPGLQCLMDQIPASYENLSDYLWKVLQDKIIRQICEIFEDKAKWNGMFLETLETWKKIKPEADQSSIPMLENINTCSEVRILGY